jgi:hypothetical protein
MVASLFVHGATLLKLSLEVIQDPLMITPQDIQKPLALNQRVLATI